MNKLMMMTMAYVFSNSAI